MSNDYFFFFKEKTADEMHISDWSSDVCSSDLVGGARHVDIEEGATHQKVRRLGRDILGELCQPLGGDDAGKAAFPAPAHQIGHRAERGLARFVRYPAGGGGGEQLGLVDDDQPRLPLTAGGTAPPPPKSGPPPPLAP